MGEQNSKMTTLSDSDLKRYRERAETRLREITETDDILRWVAIWCWFDWGNNTRCPKEAISTLSDIQKWIEDAIPQERQAWLIDATRFAHWLSENKAKRTGKNTVVFPEGLAELGVLIDFIEGQEKQVFTDDNRFLMSADHGLYLARVDKEGADSSQWAINAVRTVPSWLVTEAEKPTIEDAIKIVHAVWNAHFPEYRGRHPLAGVVEAWQKDVTAIQVTRAVDRSFPVALRLPFGAVSAEEIEAARDYHLPVFEPFDSQMILNLGDARTNQLARHLPIRSWLADWNTPSAKPRGGRGGSVPLWLRLFLEALVCGDRFSGVRTVYYEFEYLYKLMYGDKARWDIVRARTLRQMIDVASRAVVVLSDGAEVLPVNFKYFEGLERDSKIFVEVAAVRDARGGALTAIEDLRDAYRSSNATLQAYLSAGEYLDRVWTRGGRLLHDTVPERNADGVILDHLGNPIIKKVKETDKETGKKIEVEKPIKSLKGADKELLARMKRIPNPKFTPPPIYKGELVGVCWADNSIPKSQRRSYKKRALDTWDSLRIINLKEADQDNVMIRPSQEHRKTYRAIKKSSKQKG